MNDFNNIKIIYNKEQALIKVLEISREIRTNRLKLVISSITSGVANGLLISTLLFDIVLNNNITQRDYISLAVWVLWVIIAHTVLKNLKKEIETMPIHTPNVLYNNYLLRMSTGKNDKFSYNIKYDNNKCFVNFTHTTHEGPSASCICEMKVVKSSNITEKTMDLDKNTIYLPEQNPEH